VLAALTHREEHGGQRIDVSMTDVLFSWNIAHAGEHFGTDGVYDPSTSITSGAYPCYHVYETADGESLALGAIEEKFWRRFCDRIDAPELADTHLDEATRSERIELVQERLATGTRDEWLEAFGDADVPLTPVNSLGEAIESDHVASRDRSNSSGRRLASPGSTRRYVAPHPDSAPTRSTSSPVSGTRTRR
jgi:crotonobetainyl-CoA:carnitine CoA-transferase CaiB-like acyl-CoA transferase